MSSKYSPTKTNRTPWTDTISLITKTITEDTEGYESVVESTRDVFCTFHEGVSRSEFYEGMKAGLTLTASVELWQEDYQAEKWCLINSVRYKIIRAWETGRGTVELSLTEVQR